MREPRRVYFEGQFVGEVPDTGDMEHDLKAMSALLTSHGLNPLSPNQAIFRQAAAFATNATYLFNTGLRGVPPPIPMNLIPFVVNAAFAVELYLKTIGGLYGLNLRGHDLLELFDELPEEAKELLQREISGAQPACVVKDLGGFRAEIERVRHAFVKWRYLHERNRAGEIRVVEFTHVINILHNTCRTDERLRSA